LEVHELREKETEGGERKRRGRRERKERCGIG